MLDIEGIYRAINRCQLERETVSFVVLNEESAVVENILKDLTLKYQKKQRSGFLPSTEFTVLPPPEKIDDKKFDEFDEYPDEIAEEGQISFD